MTKDELSKAGKEIVSKLKETGMKTKTAKTLVSIAELEEATTKRIEGISSLRQPEVSVGVNELEDKEWIKYTKQRTEGKGRPIHIYELRKPLKNILKEIKKEEEKRIKQMKKDLKQLDSLAKKI